MNSMESPACGPLDGLRVLEFAGIGPGPQAAMVLADLGAEVLRIERPGTERSIGGVYDQQLRGRAVVEADLKDPSDADKVRRLIERADVLVEGFRPGVMERLGFGPGDCATRNSGLIYARMTGWGQSGRMAPRAGHDINYLAMTGHLRATARRGERPMPPLNLVGDMGGGAMFLVTGVLAALFERQRSGRGQTIDVAMVDGAGHLGQMMWAMLGDGRWRDEPGVNLLDTGRPFYDVYECADGEYMAVGALEPQFYAQLLNGLDLAHHDLPAQSDPSGWHRLREVFTDTFLSRTRDEWANVFEGTDACCTPVLSYAEAAADAHLADRRTIVTVDGIRQPAPAPRFSRTSPSTPRPPAREPVLLDEAWT